MKAVGPTVLSLVAAAAASAQVAPNRATVYLHPTDVADARALWVNPAGLGRIPQASVNLDLTVGDPGPDGRLRQLTVGFNSRGLSFGYQRDIFDAGARGNTYRVGFGGAHAGVALGAAASIYRGNTSGTGWDVGLVYTPGAALTVGGVVANLGQPTVRGERQVVTYLPGATWRPLGPQAALSVLGRFSSDRAREGYAFAVRWQAARGFPPGLLARLDTDRRLRRAAFAFGLSLGARDVIGALVTTPGDVSEVDAASLYGVSTRVLGR